MTKFLTKYTLPVRILHYYDDSDKVDRLSFCDTTLQIQRFIQSGENLKHSRYKAMYDTNSALKVNVPDFVPVYDSDPVEISGQIKELKESLGSRISEKIVRSKSKMEQNVNNVPKKVSDQNDSDNAT